MVLNVVSLSEKHAQAIVDAHNEAIAEPEQTYTDDAGNVRDRIAPDTIPDGTCPKCGAAADERFDCCEVYAAAAALDAPQPETVTCDHCNGSGKDPLPMARFNPPDPCPFCGGNGYTRKVPIMTHTNINSEGK